MTNVTAPVPGGWDVAAAECTALIFNPTTLSLLLLPVCADGNATLHVNDSLLHDNKAEAGGAIVAAWTVSIYLFNSTVSGCRAQYGGAYVSVQSALLVTVT